MRNLLRILTIIIFALISRNSLAVKYFLPQSFTISGGGSFCQAGGTTSLTSTVTYSGSPCSGSGGSSNVPVTYQWYTDTDATPGGGTSIGGATGASYNAPLSSTGTFYYYCVITWADPDGALACTGGSLTSSSNLTVIVVSPPTTSSNGGNQTLASCATTTTLTGNTPTTGTGTWTVAPAGPTITSPNSPNSGVTGIVPGTNYTFTWTISNPPCANSTSTMNVFAPTAPGCLVYCTPGVTTPNALYAQITNVTFNTINNTSTAATGGYVSYFPAQTTVVQAGATYNMSVSGISIYNGTGANPWRTACIMAYFDFNGDGDMLDAGEAVQIGQFAANSTTQTVNANVTIPAGAYVGANLLFNVILVEGPCPVASNPCPGAVQGAAEGYGIYVANCNMTTPNAGTDQNLAACATSTSFAGNVIANGTGTWSLVSGSGTITTPTSPTSTVTGLAPGANIFQWTGTPTDPNCPSLNDQVTITTNGLPTTANAGPDLETCLTSATLAAITPTVGTGAWSCIANCGGITFGTPTSPTSTINGLVLGTPVTIRWTTTNGACTSTDDVVVTRIAGVTAANAGPDQTGLCTGQSVTLAGNNPANGVGTWTGAGGIIANPSSPTSAINALNTAGTYTYTWTVSAPGCASSADQVNITVAFCDPNMNTVTCPGPIVWSDGAGNYADNSLIVEKFCPSTPGQYVTATFTQATFSNLLDHMIVLNGSNYSAPIIDDFYSLATINNGPTITSSASDGCLTFIFLSSPTGNAAGWSANISCTASPSTTNSTNCDWTNCLGGCLRTICGVPSSVPFTGAGVGAEELNNINGGCLAGGERCSNWFMINPTSAGTLTMNMFVNAGQDQDFAVWEAYDPLLECPSMTGDAPIMCNFAGSSAQGTGFNTAVQTLPNPAYEPTLNISAAQIAAGVYYIVLVNTYNNGGACPQPTVSVTFGGTAGLSCNPPIALASDVINLSGINEGSKNYVTWEVESESHLAYFILERSQNGFDWSYVGTKESNKSSTGSVYFMYDDHPYSPFTYYRVRQMDMNGEEKKSEIIAVSRGDIDENWVSNLLPNPTSSEFSFQYQGENFTEPVKVNIYNALGQLVYTESHNVENKSAVTISTNALANGTYQVMITQGEHKMNKKLSVIK